LVLRDNEFSKTTVNLQKDTKVDALKIAKRKGVTTMTTLVNILLAEYVEKNREILNRENHPRKG
jgi:hypothetical protein